MSIRYQVEIEGSGFHIPMSDAEPLVGFLTERRVIASDGDAAKSRAVEVLRAEPKVQRLLDETAKATGGSTLCALSATRVREISWWHWYFRGYMKGFAFWSDDINKYESGS